MAEDTGLIITSWLSRALSTIKHEGGSFGTEATKHPMREIRLHFSKSGMDAIQERLQLAAIIDENGKPAIVAKAFAGPGVEPERQAREWLQSLQR